MLKSINLHNLEQVSANQKRIDMIIRPRDRREVARYEIIAYNVAPAFDAYAVRLTECSGANFTLVSLIWNGCRMRSYSAVTHRKINRVIDADVRYTKINNGTWDIANLRGFKWQSMITISMMVQSDLFLTHCGPVTTFGYIDLDQHWRRWWLLTAPSHYLKQYWLIFSEVLWFTW